MKSACGMIVLVSLLASSCVKQEVVPAYSREKPHSTLLNSDGRINPPLTTDQLIRSFPPIPRPDTVQISEFPKLRLPKADLGRNKLFARCISSYEDVVQALGTNRIRAKAVVLDNDVIISVGENVAEIVYTAVPQVTGSSLFRSQLMVRWRPDPSTYWSGFSADVWTLGCVHANAAVGPFTNILKGGTMILINTCFFWSAGENAGVRIKHIVTD